MSSLENEQVMSTAPPAKEGFWRSSRVWILSLVVLILAAAAITTYYGWNAWHQAEMQRALIAQQQQELLLEQQRIYEEALAEVVIDTFYQGILIDGHELSGLTKDQARLLLKSEQDGKLRALSYTVAFEDQEWVLTAQELGMNYELDQVLDEAWKIGRISSATDERSQIFDRQQQIQELKENPVEFSTAYHYDEASLANYLNTIAESLYREPEAARATGFDVASKTFILSESRNGMEVFATDTIEKIKQNLDQEIFSGSYQLSSKEILPPASDLTAQLSNLKLISQATTYARAVDPPRDTNISNVARKLNGHVIQPGEEFSFNRVVGERTTAKGYGEAGSILDGVLIKTVGGGICQPNTTLYQAALKADLEIIARRPHQFPSSYTEVGLDATVSWGGSDLKFRNNTPYPIAIVSWYNKPELTFQLYGRQLPNGMSITLSAETIENKAPGEPIERLNPELAPGSRVRVRAPHNLKRARSYKIWMQDGKVVRTELADTSYYPPIPAIYEYGPPLPAPTEPVPTEPVPTDPVASEPVPTEPDPTEPTVPAPVDPVSQA